ncbi:hypothetical protein PQX77_020381 [Marasmius sp. AFHP31]|nr:hypothetical protein PQX77_020381 [Marasmius sp. AFHP31]
MITKSVLLLSLFSLVRSQGAGTLYQNETRPQFSYHKCDASGACTDQQGYLVLDANWRWLHAKGNWSSCIDNLVGWDDQYCPDGLTCAKSCEYDGAEYARVYGINVSKDSVSMRYLTYLDFAFNYGSRVFLLDGADNKYQLFDLRNQEFSFDVDMSSLPCGYNGALRFVAMDADGGMAKDPLNAGGAKYGTGYCDGNCTRSNRFVNGLANVENWEFPYNADGVATGKYGACCTEMGIWEANSRATALTAHPCSGEGVGQTRCSGSSCGNGNEGICDGSGCDFNPYRLGDRTFFGAGKVDTKGKLTVITQFLTDTNSTKGILSEIRRIYVQNGKVIQNAKTNVPGMKSFDSISDAFCDAQKTAFGDPNVFKGKGGLAAVGRAFERGMVLSMEIGHDVYTDLAWLNSNYPPSRDPSAPGVARGPCPVQEDPSQRSPTVVFSNIKVGPIGSTYAH